MSRQAFCVNWLLMARLQMWFVLGLLVGESVGGVVLQLVAWEPRRLVVLGRRIVMFPDLNYFQLL